MILQLFSKVQVILNKSMAGKQVDGSLGKALLAPRSMARGCSVLPKNCSRFLLHLSSWQGFVPSGFLHGTHWTYKYLVSLFIFNFISLVPHGLDSPLSLSFHPSHTILTMHAIWELERILQSISLPKLFTLCRTEMSLFWTTLVGSVF